MKKIFEEIIDDQVRNPVRKAFYLLLMLNKHKLHENHREPGVLLFIDEAEVLFPVKPINRERDYVQRLEERVREPQLRRPTDISAAVENLCNTKIVFRTSGAKTWISNNFGKEFVNEIEAGTCYINTMKTSKQIQAKVSVPFVGDEQGNCPLIPSSFLFSKKLNP